MRVVRLIVCASLLTSAAVAGPITAPRKSQFERAMSVIMASVTPYVSDAKRESLIRDYVEAKPNKAQAVEPANGSYFRFTNSEDYDATGDRALESCQLRYGKPCALIAINDEIAGEGEITPKDMPRLHYAGATTLGADTTLTAGTGAIDFTSTVDGLPSRMMPSFTFVPGAVVVAGAGLRRGLLDQLADVVPEHRDPVVEFRGREIVLHESS